MKKKILSILGLSFIVYSLLFIISPVFAAEECKPGGLLAEVSEKCACEGDCQLIDILKLARGISLNTTKFVGVVALVFFIVGGIIWMTSGGNAEQVKKGKKILIGSLIGILIVFFAWHIVNLVICAISQGEIAQSCKIFETQEWFKFPK